MIKKSSCILTFLGKYTTGNYQFCVLPEVKGDRGLNPLTTGHDDPLSDANCEEARSYARQSLVTDSCVPVQVLWTVDSGGTS